MTKAMLTTKETEILNRLTDGMQRLHASLSKASLTEEEAARLSREAYGTLGDFESEFAVRIPTIRPEVPEDARTLFVSLLKLVYGLPDGE